MSKRRLVLVLMVLAASLIVLFLALSQSDSHLFLADTVKRLKEEKMILHRDVQELSVRLSQQGMVIKSQGKLSQGIVGMKETQTENLGACETIHVATVAVGYITVRHVVTLIKSILFYRHNPLSFHFVSDDIGEYILRTIFRTWELPAVNVSFYSANKAQEQVAWIPNSHYSGVFGLMKLTLPSILPTSLQKVIVLDTDLMFLSDILSLWKYFEVTLTQGKLLGLVENQSNWYLGKLWDGHRPWPALGRGFNTGVILLNLELMRAHNWNSLWNEVATRTVLEYESTTLADQDIVNAILNENQHLHYVLPCVWNAQLSEHSLSDYCFKNAYQFKLVHWNSPLKQNVENKYGPYFKSMYKLLQNHNGDLLREALFNCNQQSRATFEPTAVKSDPCIDFREENELIHRTHPFLLEFAYKPIGVNDVTLVTQMSMDRLHMLEPLCAHWDGPLSIALYATDSEVQQFLEYLSTFSVRTLKRLALHVVYKSHTRFYPVNYLRNVALDNVNTGYVFLSDIDFIPMEGAYPYLLEAVKILGESRRALIVPAFETQSYKFTHPSDKAELLKMLQDGTVFTFRSQVWKQGHAPTNFEHWVKTSTPYKIRWAPDFEPYIVVQSNVTRYDQRFAGFGWNKVSHIMELNAQRYDFVVLPNVFMIHMPHSPSLDINLFRKSKLYRDCVQVIKAEFSMELENKYFSMNSTL